MYQNESDPGTLDGETVQIHATAHRRRLPNVVIGAIAVALFLLLAVVIWLSASPPPDTLDSNAVLQPTPDASATPSPAPMSQMARLEKYLEPVPNSLVLYPGNQNENEFPPEDYAGPVSVVVVDTRASDCDAAKRLSYDLLESVYTDESLEGFVEKVQITSPGFV